MSVPTSENAFLQTLEESGLLDTPQLQRIKDRLSTSGPVTATQLCDDLVRRGLITEWQSEKLCQGRYRGFFLGSYVLLSRLAKGGMSTVYSARHQPTGEIHALKVLPRTRTSSASYLPRFQREAAIMQRLQHPHIATVYGVFSDSDGQDTVHCMSMELLRGRDLFAVVNSDGPLPFRDAAEYIRQAAIGLEYAHQAGLVHRDVKPANLFLTEDRVIRILDLGLAQDFDSDESLTRDFNERVLGTADYLAPEQATDSHTVDSRADIYGLGCSLYFLLTGQPPFTDGTLAQRLMAHQMRKPPDVSEFRTDVPKSLLKILADMMAKQREERIATAADVSRRLQRFLDDVSSEEVCERVLSASGKKGAAIADPEPGPEPGPEYKADEYQIDGFRMFLQTIIDECRTSGPFGRDRRRLELLNVVNHLMNQDAESSSDADFDGVRRNSVRESQGIDDHSRDADDLTAVADTRSRRHVVMMCVSLLLFAAVVVTAVVFGRDFISQWLE